MLKKVVFFVGVICLSKSLFAALSGIVPVYPAAYNNYSEMQLFLQDSFLGRIVYQVQEEPQAVLNWYRKQLLDKGWRENTQQATTSLMANALQITSDKLLHFYKDDILLTVIYFDVKSNKSGLIIVNVSFEFNLDGKMGDFVVGSPLYWASNPIYRMRQITNQYLLEYEISECNEEPSIVVPSVVTKLSYAGWSYASNTKAMALDVGINAIGFFNKGENDVLAISVAQKDVFTWYYVLLKKTTLTN